MPRYDFVCDNADAHESGKRIVKEFNLPMSESSTPQVCPLCGAEMKRKFHPVRRVYKSHAGKILDPDMTETQAEEALYQRIEETND